MSNGSGSSKRRREVEGSASVRPPKSRRDRPCDHCRRLKHTCQISVRGEACLNCTKGKRKCTFDEPPTKRFRVSAALSRSGLDELATCPRPALAPYIEPPLGCPTSSPENTHARGLEALVEPNARADFNTRRRADPGSSTMGLRDVNDQHCKTVPGGSLGMFMDVLALNNCDASFILSDPSETYRSLDQDTNDMEESHYLGHRALGQLVLDPVLANDGLLASSADPTLPGKRLFYRQVASARDPAYFLRNPSMVYGVANTDYVEEKAYVAVCNILRQVQDDLPERLVQLFLSKSLPAIPLLDRSRLESACYSRQTATGFPFSILTGILVHAAVHVPSLRHKIKELWGIVLHLIDNEYRHPRLQTLQLALLDIYGRPELNPGGNHIPICRATGTAQLLGLHRNCEKWKLPRWERQIRQRVWWCLYIADKWNAFCSGRPSNMPSPQLVPIPTRRQSDNLADGSHDSFITACKLSVILDRLLPILGTHRFGSGIDGAQILLTGIAQDLDNVAKDLTTRDESGNSAVRLSHISLSIVICRLSLEDRSDILLDQLLLAMNHAVKVVGDITKLLEHLDTDDWGGYWSPWSSYQIIHGISFLLSIIQTTHGETNLRPTLETASEHLARQVKALQRGVDASWEVAEVTLPRVKVLVDSVPNIKEVREISLLLAPPPSLADPNPIVPPLNQGQEVFDFEEWFNSTDWMLGMGLGFDGLVDQSTTI